MTDTLLENFGFICLVLTVACTFISYVTPYWVVSSDYITGTIHQGLLALYEPNTLLWLPSDEKAMGAMSDWFKATQGLMSVGLGLSLLALLIATLSLCCTCQSCNPHQGVCGLLLISCISMAVGIVVFGVKASDEWKIGIENKIGNAGKFGWSFWVGVAAVAAAFTTSLIYCCIERKRR